jgi:hypothetical protein
VGPPLPFDEYVAKLRASRVLLLVASRHHNLFMPSKFVDYFGARRPVLAFVPRGSEMRRVLEEAGMAQHLCDELDVAGGGANIQALWRRYRDGTLEADAPRTTPWSSEVQLPRYLGLLKAGKSQTGLVDPVLTCTSAHESAQ